MPRDESPSPDAPALVGGAFSAMIGCSCIGDLFSQVLEDFEEGAFVGIFFILKCRPVSLVCREPKLGDVTGIAPRPAALTSTSGSSPQKQSLSRYERLLTSMFNSIKK